MVCKLHGIHVPVIVQCLVSALAMLLLSCIVQSDPPSETLHFVHAVQPDTIAPWGKIEVVFTERIADPAQTGFVFAPPYYAYAIMWNASHDSVLLQCIEPLQGDTRYVLRLKGGIVSKNGTAFIPSSDSIVFFTHPVEQEPNGTPPTADTLHGRCFGAVATISDTDRYIITDQAANAVFLISSGSQTTFFLSTADDSATAPQTFKPRDTLIITERFRPPVFVGVHSYHQSVGGYYEVGIIAED
ncbi:MAG: hypothetical protein JXA18_05365 [Chitinispirillaceae bacterium]|nr:hypothetical protein [Chitinispirillaceae bacterium]